MKEVKPKPKILVIEDDRQMQKLFGAWLEDEVELLIAPTIQGARELFLAHRPEIALIAIDACVPMADGAPRPKEPTTIPLVLQLREKFPRSRRMVAISGNHDWNEWLVQAGCDHMVEKNEFPQFVLDLLRDGKL